MVTGTEVDRLERFSATGAVEPQATLLELDAARLARTAAAGAPAEHEERPLWQLLAVLYGSIAFLVVFLIAVAFGVSKLVTGAAY